MANDIIKNVHPNIRCYDNGDTPKTWSVATKDFNSDAILANLLNLVASGMARQGVVTDVPNVTTFRVVGFIGLGSTLFRNWAVYVLWKTGGLGAAPQGEMQVASAFNSADGTFTHPAFTAPLVVGDKVLLIHPWLIANLDWLNGGRLDLLLDAIKARTDNLAGAAPVVGTTAAMNLFAGVATSGETGADLVTIGANDTRNKVLSFLIDSTGITAAAIITVRMYQQINGTARKVYSQQFLMGTDTVGLWIIQAAVGIHEALRVEVQSSAAGDVNVTLGYDGMIEVM